MYCSLYKRFLKFNYICLSFYIRAAIPFVFLHQGVIDMRIAYLLK